MNTNFVVLSVFGILVGLTGHESMAQTTATSDSTVGTATNPTDATPTSVDGDTSTVDATTVTDPTDATPTSVDGETSTVDTATLTGSTLGGSSSGGGDSGSGTTAGSNTASDMNGTTTADSASTPKADNCYSLTHSCNQTTNVSLCFADFMSSQENIDTCPRNDKYCQVKGTVKDNTTILESGCVEASCDHEDYTSDSEGHVIVNCCDSHLCNEEKLLYAGSPSLRGVLPLVLLAAAAAVAVGGGASTAGTNIVV